MTCYGLCFSLLNGGDYVISACIHVLAVFGTVVTILSLPILFRLPIGAIGGLTGYLVIRAIEKGVPNGHIVTTSKDKIQAKEDKIKQLYEEIKKLKEDK